MENKNKIKLIRVVNPKNRYDQGFLHGKLAKEIIQSYLVVSEELKTIRDFTNSEYGKPIFEDIVSFNSKHFPETVQELQGIADGAEVDIQEIWRSNLIFELSSIIGGIPGLKCTDIYFKKKDEIIHGHTEDWSEELKPYIYFLAFGFETVEYERNSNVSCCAGLTYPGMLLGTSITFNKWGVKYVQNCIFPKKIRSPGKAMTFIGRKACDSKSVPELISIWMESGQMYGYNVNIVYSDKKAKEMNELINVEVHQEEFAIKRIVEGFYSHQNIFKILQTEQNENAIESSNMRAKIIESFPIPESRVDVLQILGEPGIHKNITVATYLYETPENRISIWVDGDVRKDSPNFEWNLDNFWDEFKMNS